MKMFLFKNVIGPKLYFFFCHYISRFTILGLPPLIFFVWNFTQMWNLKTMIKSYKSENGINFFGKVAKTKRYDLGFTIVVQCNWIPLSILTMATFAWKQTNPPHQTKSCWIHFVFMGLVFFYFWLTTILKLF